ncbi:MAG: hypothetical protein DRI95_11730 [Bacteroidetes bacterium]|nr:MAG: hypothetical protein DRI95_11730 [Bacteroidota bacterium]
MNTFVHIKLIAKYKKVIYYSVCINDRAESLFENFIGRHTDTNRKKLNHILSWIKIIGNKYGAKVYHFRPEAEISDTSALPPKGVKKEPSYIEHGKKKSNNLRLYCFRANERVVFLFNGDIKTQLKAQDCPNVKQHFKTANKITKALENAFVSREIEWNEEYDGILFDEDLKIDL